MFRNPSIGESSTELELLERILTTVHIIACRRARRGPPPPRRAPAPHLPLTHSPPPRSVFAFIIVAILFFASSYFRVLPLYLLAILLWSSTSIPFCIAILRFFEGSAGAIARAKRPDMSKQFSTCADSAALDSSLPNGSEGEPGRNSSYTAAGRHRSSCEMCSSFTEEPDPLRSPHKRSGARVQWGEALDKGAARIRSLTPASIKGWSLRNRASDRSPFGSSSALVAEERSAEHGAASAEGRSPARAQEVDMGRLTEGSEQQSSTPSASERTSNPPPEAGAPPQPMVSPKQQQASAKRLTQQDGAADNSLQPRLLHSEL